jgi:hypothetical protein
MAVALLTGLALLTLALPAEAGAQTLDDPLTLRCQVQGGPWRNCQMRVHSLGEHWTLVVGREEFAFQHDGKGSIRMRTARTNWVNVQPRWREDATLCWDGVCAQGDIPLD